MDGFPWRRSYQKEIEEVMMEKICFEVWMSIIGASMAVGAIPQMVRLYQRKSSGDMSILLWFTLWHGLFWWLLYGIYIHSISLIVTNSISLILDGTVIYLIFLYRRKRNDCSTKGFKFISNF